MSSNPKKGSSGSSTRPRNISPAGKASVSFLLNREDTPPAHPVPPSSRRDAGAEPRQRNFVCPTCPKAFYTKSNLTKHISSVHQLRKPFKCDHCDKTFGEKSNATKHFKSVHAGQKNAPCPQCNSTFAFRDGLLRHIRLVHDGRREFACDVAGCRSPPFKQLTHLKKHKLTIHKVKS